MEIHKIVTSMAFFSAASADFRLSSLSSSSPLDSLFLRLFFLFFFSFFRFRLFSFRGRFYETVSIGIYGPNLQLQNVNL
jgi:hypothetical protein